MPHLALFLLGPPRLERDGQVVEMDTRKALALLAYLAVTRQAYTRDGLAALFWPDYDQSGARAALRRTLSVLRRALGECCLQTNREFVRLSLESDFWIDAARFQQHLTESATHSHPPSLACLVCLELLKDAAELYRGDFLAGFSLRDSPAFDDWQLFQTEGFKREAGSVLARLARGCAAQQDFEAAIRYTRRWLGLDPLLEDAHRMLMQSYAWAGQRNAALRQYRECVRILEQELGVPPLEETTRLYQAILEGKALPRAVLAEPFVEVAQPLAAVESAPPSPAEQPSVSSAYPLVGRAREWQALQWAYAQIHTDGYFLALEGESGIGKTRLAEEFLAQARQRGAVVFAARCYAGESGLSYGPVADALRFALSQPEVAARLERIPAHWLVEAVRLLPELAALRPGLPPASASEGPGAQPRFFEGLRQVLLGLASAESPAVFFLDDLEWADEASLDFLVYLLRRLTGCPLFFLVTWHSTAVPSGHRLRQLSAQVEMAGRGRLLSLGRFTPAQVSELVQSLAQAGAGIPAEAQERLYNETEGLPFFVVEYLEKLLKAQPDTAVPGEKQFESPEAWAMPMPVRELLQLRLALAGEAGWQLLTSAAVIGRSFDFRNLLKVSGRSEMETLTGLEALLAQGLIKEQRAGEPAGEGTYGFTHDKIRLVIYEQISQTRRHLLHQRVAEVLAVEMRSRPGGEALASRVAYHFQQGGRHAHAADYYKQAGDYARSLFAQREAVGHYQEALALGHPDQTGLHEAIGDLHTLLGEYRAAQTSYETAAALSGLENLPGLEYKLANLHHRRGDWSLADCHFQAALDAHKDSAPENPASKAWQARLLADWGLNAHRSGDPRRARRLAQAALQLAEAADSSHALAQAHNTLGVLFRSQKDLTQAAAHLEKSLALAEKLAEPPARIAALNNLALVYQDRGAYTEAIRLAQIALEACQRFGDRHREAALLNNLADLYHTAGRTSEAIDYLLKAVVIFAEIGGEAGGEDTVADGMMPEIWKLTEW